MILIYPGYFFAVQIFQPHFYTVEYFEDSQGLSPPLQGQCTSSMRLPLGFELVCTLGAGFLVVAKARECRALSLT